MARTDRSAYARRRRCSRVGILDHGARRRVRSCGARSPCEPRKILRSSRPRRRSRPAGQTALAQHRLRLHDNQLSSRYQGGTGTELKARLEKRSKGVPVILPTMAATEAVRALKVRRVALFHPPWFTDDAVKKGVAYFESQGFEVVHASRMTPARGVPHPNLGSDVSPAELYEFVRKHTPANAECVFIAGNGFRTIGVIAALEEDLGIPVLTGNQVAFWHALRLAGVRAQVDDYGQVFRTKLRSK